MATILNADTVSGGAVVTGDSSGEIQLQGGGTPRLTFNTSGAMGVGSSPSYGTSGQVLTSAGTGGAPTWAAAVSPFSTGDVKTSVDTTSYTAPNWLPCDSASYSNSTYPSLAAKLPDTDFPFDATGDFRPYKIFYLNGIYVATGFGIWTSPDSITWTLRVPLSNSLVYYAAGNGSSTIVASSYNGVYTSTDNGVNWKFYNVGNAVSVAYDFVAFGATRFVVSASNGSTYYSSNGTTWTLVTGSPSSCDILKFVGSAFILCNNNGSGSILYSTDGITFTRTGPANITFRDITFGNSTYVVVGNSGAVYTATSLGSWTSRSAGSTNFNAVAYGATSGQFVAVGDSNGTKTVIYSSPTGVTWTLTSSSLTLADAMDVASDGTNYVVLTNNSVYYTSSNGTTWTNNLDARLATNSSGYYPGKIQYSNSQWLMVSFYNVVYTSANSTTWTARLNTSRDISVSTSLNYFYKNKIASNGTITVIPALNGVTTTTDNVTFTYRGFNNIIASSNATRQVAYNGTNTFVAITSTAALPSYSSTDGITWTASGTTLATGTPQSLTTNGSGTWVMGTSVGSVYYSTNNGSTWTAASISGASNTSRVDYANGYFYVFGNSAYHFSTDGITWYPLTSSLVGNSPSGTGVINNILFITDASNARLLAIKTPASEGYLCNFKGANISTITDVAYGNNTYVAVGIPGVAIGPAIIWYSTDGYTFFAVKLPFTGINSNPYINAVSYINNKFYAFSTDNILYTSIDGKSWISTRIKSENMNSVVNAITYAGSRYALLGTAFVAKESTTTFRTPLIDGPVPSFIKT